MRSPVRRLWVALTLTAVTSGLFVPSASAVIPPGGILANVVAESPPTSSQIYRTVDYGTSTSATDDRHARTTWRVVEQQHTRPFVGPGNCCEMYVTSDARGWLYEFGGNYIHFSPDRGVTWRRVQPLVPLVNGEGAIVVAPDGDILGVEWDPYSGDHLQIYKYDSTTREWRYNELPFHEPFYDREWISVAPGPITIDGTTYPYVSFIKGGVPKEAWFYSTDGINYSNITSKILEQLLSGNERKGTLPASPHWWNDIVQANTNGGMFHMGHTSLLAAPDFGSQWMLFNGRPEHAWYAYSYPNGSAPQGRFQVDAAGRIHNVIPSEDGATFQYRISADDARTWTTRTFRLPAGYAFEEWDFRTNRAAGVAAIGIRAQGPVNDQDLVFKLDIRTNAPFLKRLYSVGRGDVNATGGVGNDVRFDFGSITIFPDGRVATAFMDSTTTGPTTQPGERKTPAIAIEGTTTLGSLVKPQPVVTPRLGQVYKSYTFDTGAQSWTTSGTPTWSRATPGANSSTGADVATESGWKYEGSTQYVPESNASVTSPRITTQAGLAVVQFWLKSDTEDGFDFVHLEWSRDGTNWTRIAQFTGRNAAYPRWTRIVRGFTSPGGAVQVRFRFTSDQLCSALDSALCFPGPTGARVDEVIVGKQAP